MDSARNNLESALRRLQADGLATRDGDVLCTTRKWQRAMARAALRLYEARDPGLDLRVPIASALLEIYGACVDDEELAALVEAMLPLEARALGLGDPSASPP
jgi:hypothetical protein